MKPGEDIIIDHGLKNKWRWAWIEVRGGDGKPFGSWCQKLREPGIVSVCCAQRSWCVQLAAKKLRGTWLQTSNLHG